MPAAKTFFGSLSRIADFHIQPWETHAIPRQLWEAGDYVVGEVLPVPGALNKLELDTGRMIELFPGDRVVGALGSRRATLEAVGDWRAIGDDGQFQNLTSAGLFGRATSRSQRLPPLNTLRYVGHAVRNDQKIRMRDFVRNVTSIPFDIPTVLLIGTSMSCGKTTSGRIIVHELHRAGLRVVAAKLTGAGRYRDILALGDAGAVAIYDFVDAGLPSTACPEPEYRAALQAMLSMIASHNPDVAVIESGASPLEPYNGATAIQALRSHVAMTVLCASDPYGVVGAMKGFDLRPDLVAGIAASTTAGVDLVQELSGVPALNVVDQARLPELREHLREALPALLGNERDSSQGSPPAPTNAR